MKIKLSVDAFDRDLLSQIEPQAHAIADALDTGDTGEWEAVLDFQIQTALARAGEALEGLHVLIDTSASTATLVRGDEANATATETTWQRVERLAAAIEASDRENERKAAAEYPEDEFPVQRTPKVEKFGNVTVVHGKQPREYLRRFRNGTL